MNTTQQKKNPKGKGFLYFGLALIFFNYFHFRSVPRGENINTFTSFTKEKPITRISLLGERNSGTTWIYEELLQCYNGTSLSVKRGLNRYKHWFQYEDENTSKEPTLVIAQFRDVYYWIEAMRKKPHHASEHMFLEWEDFVKKPWTMPRVGLDLEIEKSLKHGSSLKPSETSPCQQQFAFHEIVSCVEKPFPTGYFTWKQHWSEHRPLYELNHDGSGRPYPSILDLRADKIRNHLKVSKYSNVRDFVVVRYEKLVQYGTQFLLEHIEEVTGVKAKCSPTEGQNRTLRDLDDNFVKYVTEQVDWSAEELIGYSKLN